MPDYDQTIERTENKSQHEQAVLVWDLLLRVFHWSLAMFFLTAYFLESRSLNLHVHVGYTIALLVVFRVIWGLIGSDTARFSNFVVSPWQSLHYLAMMLKGVAAGNSKEQEQADESYEHTVGHNPAGAAMIVALLTMLLFTTLSGMALYGLEGPGPLATTFVIIAR